MNKKNIALLFFLAQHSASAHSWAQAEFLFWAIKKNGTAIPFVTQASLSDPLPGALGQPGTEVALSSCSVSPTKHPGFRALLGTSLHEEKNIDLEANYFLLPERSCKKSLATSGQPGSPNFAVPVFDTTGVWGLNGIPGETIAVLPGPLGSDPGFDGSFSVCGANRFQGAELQALFQCAHWNDWSLTVSTGFAWMQLLESIVLNVKTSTDSNASIPS
ncbi:MAG TPA: BBP7 family outer membrane beta-barrel protein, partial [Candidatus Babeliales bacterium]|nr:BBP7 family outer membrane beta-barrel protein [Candidatus Babeliales bacterium]